MMEYKYQQCTKTVMDTSDPDIIFDDSGICNYWHDYHDDITNCHLDENAKKTKLQNKINEIKSYGKNKKYDCIIGLSGGVDSSYLAYLAKSYELRPLVVHFDNGWNTELATHNIEQLVIKLDFDLHTFVMDWQEFRDLQRSYFKASVLDLEVPTDHMIFGALYKIASEYGIKYVLSGNNYVTEYILPKSWYFNKFDLVNMKDIQKTYGTCKLKNLPGLGVWQAAYYHLIKRIEDVKLLDMISYNKHDAKILLANEFSWRDYGGKHYESIFTRFYQGYILPNKFNIDKRRAHLSNLICSGHMTREEALEELGKPTYDERLQQEDKIYIAKKLGFSEPEFDAILNLPNVSHEQFKTDEKQREFYFKIMRLIKPLTSIVKRFYK